MGKWWDPSAILGKFCNVNNGTSKRGNRNSGTDGVLFIKIRGKVDKSDVEWLMFEASFEKLWCRSGN